jgi:hypothetical protein
MKIIIRSCGERTEKKCVELAEREGNVFLIKEMPFGESIRKTYELALTFSDKWICVVDADVQLFPGMLQKGIDELNRIGGNVFCLDGKTDDKIFMYARRAGIHIYKRSLLKKAMQFIDNNHIKPETNIRRKMAELGHKTYTSRIIFGKHDYDQFYVDLWRKAVCQTQKLARKTKGMPQKWAKLAKKDKDYLVIFYGHIYGKKYCKNIVIDKRINFDARKQIKKLGLKEKDRLK